MAARGSQAKAEISKKIIECFGQENVIESGGKLYITTRENGEILQIAISLTCPKVMVGVEASTTPKSSFSGGAFESFGAATVEPEPFKPAEISNEERATVMELMKRLNL